MVSTTHSIMVLMLYKSSTVTATSFRRFVPPVGAEVAVAVIVVLGGVAEHDLVPGPEPNELPPDGFILELVVVSLRDEAAAEADRRRGVGGGEVAAAGGAAEEHVLVVLVVAVHHPRHVHGRAMAAEGDAKPVLVGVEVGPVDATPQPHVLPVEKLVHQSLPALLDRRRAEAVATARWRDDGLLALRRAGEEARRGEMFVEECGFPISKRAPSIILTARLLEIRTKVYQSKVLILLHLTPPTS
jgi:hypothetical protein